MSHEDRIGWHLAEARVQTLHEQGWYQEAESAEGRGLSARLVTTRLEHSAKAEGAAAGHAFRAAELAYDAGQDIGVTARAELARARQLVAACRLHVEHAAYPSDRVREALEQYDTKGV